MTIWIIAVFLTLGASVALLRPLLRKQETSVDAAAFDREVYKDQLEELERDEARGLISGKEATEARAEIGRRLLKADAQLRAQTVKASSTSPRVIAGAAVLAVPLVSWGLYADLGSPSAPDQPLAMRMQKNPTENTIDELVARAEEHLRKNPSDATGWEVLGPIYMRLGRFDESADAWRNLIRLKGENANRLNGLGEALGAGAQGIVAGPSLAAFEKALELDPANEKSRFFVAVGAAQAGRLDEARTAWTRLSEDAAPDSPWRQAALRAIEESRNAPAVAAAEAPGPTAEDMANASQMSAADRQSMIAGMVDRLAGKLKDNPDDEQGWQRLIRAYAVMGRKEDAAAALASAREAFAGKPDALARLDGFAASVGIADGAQASPAAPGPTAEDVANASQMSATDRQSMIEGMVDRLAGKLKDNPDDEQGWQRLIRAYAVMGRKDDATAALTEALAAFDGKPDESGRITAFAASLGIEPAAKTD
ncbi:c-type cytochrome biogenesis protein CcmI [Zhengella mangrovi]|nr:c-type cytochrome biogenesis protein CcmI [Zhengella mangrovi]